MRSRCSSSSFTPETLTGLLLALILAVIWLLPAWIAMVWVTPRELVLRYFRTPHFNSGELVAYTGFPGCLLRTVVFMGACFSDHYRRGRQMEDVFSYAPRWYVRTARTFNIFAISHFVLIAALMSGLLIYSVLVKP